MSDDRPTTSEQTDSEKDFAVTKEIKEPTDLDLDFSAIKSATEKQQPEQQELVHPGIYLRKARKDLNMDCEEIANLLKLNLAIIKSIECGDEDHLPGKVFTAGYLRGYSKLVGLSPTAIVTEYHKYLAKLDSKKADQPVNPDFSSKINLKAAITEKLSLLFLVKAQGAEAYTLRYAVVGVAVLAVMVIGVIVALTDDSRQEEQHVVVTETIPLDGALSTTIVGRNDRKTKNVESPRNMSQKALTTRTLTLIQQGQTVKGQAATNTARAKSDSTTNQPVETPSKSYVVQPLDLGQMDTSTMDDEDSDFGDTDSVVTVNLAVKFSSESWVDIRDATGERLVRSVGKPGVTKEVTGVAPFKVLIGYGPGVVIEYNGELVDFSGQQIKSVARFTLAAAKELATSD